MIIHLVLIRLKPDVARDDPRVTEALAELVALRERVEGVVRWEHGWDFVRRPISYDFALVAGFASRPHFDAYGPHPAHQAVAAKLRELVDWVLCDFEA
ncbi:Dabb family protein [Variovorax sp. KK3]|uniref:Dabb family protein n=1 Tax=Variovorax sp. KK3 TaxID=1855728 RepID=UPI00097BBB0F|nr:Dabb family protein [Variovorax sp. KK3]